MPIKCYRKPNRKKPRVFTARDVCRIAEYAIEDGANPEEIADCICEDERRKVRELRGILIDLLAIAGIALALSRLGGRVGRQVLLALIRALVALGLPGARELRRILILIEEDLGNTAEIEVLIEKARRTLETEVQ